MRRFALSLCGFFAIIPICWGNTLNLDEAGIAQKWYQNPVAIDVRLSNLRNQTDGTSQASAALEAIALWNAHLGAIQLKGTITPVASAQDANGRNEMSMDRQIRDEDFPEGTLAVELTDWDGNEVVESDIIFNSFYTWDSYRGDLTNEPDIRRVALHELGHLLGLNHPDKAGQGVRALMNSIIGDLDHLSADDITGGHRLYGVPSSVPPNDAFANAIEFQSNSIVDQYTGNGTNINATRETNEPDHLDVTFGHSVWWKWMPSEAVRITATTLGSEFDTIMAVYTGSSPDNLTLIASNDDEELPEDNPTPARKRNSIVTFNAVAGTTYFFAVDGWGDPERFPSGSTGHIEVKMNTSPEPVVPQFIEQPEDRTTGAGSTAQFRFRLADTPLPTIKWQKQVSGSETWVDLSTGSTYSVRLDSQGNGWFSFEALFNMNGDRFRCVASNSLGETISETVTLTVYPGNYPHISIRPVDTSLRVGEPGLLAVVAGGYDQYQWFHNGVAIPGETAPQLVFEFPQLTDSGSYRIDVTNATGTSSETVEVDVTNPPRITNVGETRRVLLGNPSLPFELTVQAEGEGSLTYQWVHEGRPIPGANTATYRSESPTRKNIGAYWARVSDVNGTRNGAPFFVLPRRQSTRLISWGIDDPAMRTSSIVAGLNGSTFVETRYSSSVVWDSAGMVTAWSYILPALTMATPIDDVVAVSFENHSALMLRSDGTVFGNGEWGDIPPNISHVYSVKTDGSNGLVLRTDGTVLEWTTSDILGSPEGLRNVRTILRNQKALLNDGRLVSWAGDYSARTIASGLTDVSKIVSHGDYYLALRTDGTVVSGGERYAGTGEVPNGLDNIVDIATGEQHSLALKADGTFVGWGENRTGQLDAPTTAQSVLAISVGQFNSYALVADESADSRIANLSVRSSVSPTADTLIMGFVIAGEGSQQILLRAIGPGISQLDPDVRLADPRLELFDHTQTRIDSNTSWQSSSEVMATFARLGAFPLPMNSRDAALLRTLPQGAYTTHVSANDDSTGIVLIEVFDGTKNGPTRLSNISARTQIGTGADILIAGFVVEGTAPKTLLIRGVGPTLANYGLAASTLLSDPKLSIFQDQNLVAENDNWGGTSTLKDSFTALGAFTFRSDESKDAAMLVTLDPGVYSVHLSGVDEAEGVGLVEVYEIR